MTSAPTPGGPSWQHEPAAPTAGPPASSPFFRWVRGLDVTRAPDRWVGGVAGGIARRTGLDLALVRGIIVILSVFGGIGVLLYGVAWALLPEPDGRIHLEQAGRGSWNSGLTGAAALVAIGLLRSNVPLFGDGGTDGLLWTLFWIGAVVLFVYWIVERSGGGSGHRGGPGGAPGPQGPGEPGPGGPGAGGPGSDGPDPRPAAPASGPSPAGEETDDGGPAAQHDPDGQHGQHGPDRTVPLPYRPETLTRPLPGPFTVPSDPGGADWPGSGSHVPFPSSYPSSYSSSYPSDPGSEPVPARPSRAVRVRPRGPSGSAAALIIGGALVVAAALLAADHLGVLALADPAVVACAAGAVVLALGVILLGLRGRTSGLVGLTATLALLGGLIASVTGLGGTWIVAQDGRSAPSSVRGATDGHSIMAGRGTIDLTDVPRPAQEVVVPVNALAGEVTVIIPEDVPVRLRTHLALGAANTRGAAIGSDTTSNATRTEGGLLQLIDRDLNPEAPGPAIVLDVRGALSDITVATGSPDTSTRPPSGDTP